MAVLAQETMARRSSELQKAGKRIVFTNGCFDIVHRGHIDLLRQARSKGDYLFVGINSDQSVRRLKGNNRPIQSAEDRAIILNALTSIDDVTIFHEDTPERLISMIKPNVLVKGADYEEDKIVGAELVRSWGGQVVRIPLVKDCGTQKILNKIMAISQGEIT